MEMLILNIIITGNRTRDGPLFSFTLLSPYADLSAYPPTAHGVPLPHHPYVNTFCQWIARKK